MIIDVAINRPVLRTFHYLVPEEFQNDIEVGKRVKVSFGRTTEIAFIVGILKESPFDRLKKILEVIDSEPLAGKSILRLTKWISEYYICAWGESLFAAVPSNIKSCKKELVVEPKDRLHTPFKLNKDQEKIVISILKSLRKSVFEPHLLYGVTGSGKTEVYINLMEKVVEEGKGVIVLVPEISLTSQIFKVINARFKEEVSVWPQ